MTEIPEQPATLAAHMALLAEVFCVDARRRGHEITVALADVPRIDDYVDTVVQQQPSEQELHELIVSGGAYVGQVLVAAGLASWSEDNLAEPTLVLPNGMTGKPMDKVAKRVHIGGIHSLAQYVDFVVTGADPTTFPGAQVHDLRGSVEKD